MPCSKQIRRQYLLSICTERFKAKFNKNYAIVKLSPLGYYNTKDNLREGNYIDFVLVQDIEINGKIYKRGTGNKARAENVSQNGAYGVPADLVVDNFVLVLKGGYAKLSPSKVYEIEGF